MQFIMSGQVFRLEDLDDAINDAFIELHAAYLSNQPLNWADFEGKANAFFNRADNTAGLQDKFFTNFSVIWRSLLASGQLDAAEHIWQMALQPALSWESQNKGRFIHKGTPFYFWGLTSILKGDLDRGFTLIHQSVGEDCRTDAVKFPDTPGFAFATLNYVKTDQAFRDWVLFQVKKLSETIQTYSKLYNTLLTLDDFQKRFLTNPPKVDTIFLFVYTLARLNRLQDVPAYALASDFAGQMEMNLLFDLALVIDAAIKAKNTASWKFIDHATYLSTKAGLEVSKEKFGEINGEFGNDFDRTLATILSGGFRFKDGSALSGVENDIAITYGVRNHAAHNISSVPTIWKEFDNIKQRLFNTLFLAVEALY
ncbi:MAG TPA: hypothetical protein VEF34_00545 [Syntrophobacteraceae bacterium]|nr:hypothetical protein [Syntrophobacteraceae bacterium]